jgi:DNA-binding transcriptional LysR family regulator
MPHSVDELLQQPIIGFDRDATSWTSIGSPAPGITRDSFAFRCDSDLAQLAALRAGLGIGGCQHGIARRDRQLVPVLPRELAFSLEMWLAMHEDLRASRRVRLLFEHLAGELGGYAAL